MMHGINPTQITIRGYLVGPIWWPIGAECFKELHYDLTREDERFSEPGTLRDHILRATNDGDFQHCSIAQGEVSITVTRWKGKTARRISRTWPLAFFGSVKDCLHEDPDWWPTYGDDD